MNWFEFLTVALLILNTVCWITATWIYAALFPTLSNMLTHYHHYLLLEARRLEADHRELMNRKGHGVTNGSYDAAEKLEK